MDTLHSIVYISSATHKMTDADLNALLEASRKRNAENSLTGALLYSDGNFMQMLEGPQPSIESAMRRIHASKLHHGIIVLIDEPVSVREFASWHMAFKHVAPHEFLSLRDADWVRADDRLTVGRELLRQFLQGSRAAL